MGMPFLPASSIGPASAVDSIGSMMMASAFRAIQSSKS